MKNNLHFLITRFGYCIELNIEEDGSVKFVMPAVLGERYGIGGTTTAQLAADGKKLNTVCLHLKSKCIFRFIYKF